MGPLSNPVTILVLTSREEEAEGVITALRNGGLAVQGVFTSELERLRDMVSSNAVELVLCCEYDPAISLGAWMSKYRELDLDIPLVIIAGETTESTTLIGALRTGARDLTEKGDTDHLQIVVGRELSDLHHRRAEIQLRERLEECEKRSRDLVDATGEAVAFFKEGIHVQVNPAYQELFGFESADELDGFPLLDLIVADSQQQVGETLRSVERHSATVPVELDVKCVHADGESFDAHLSLSRSDLEGEPCVRVMAKTQPLQTQQSAPEALDADTALPNRMALMEELASRVATAGSEDKPFAIIYIGINIFSSLLQDRGLTGGLKAVARYGALLRDLAPEGTYLARVRDDGYVLLVTDLGKADALELTVGIKQRVRLPIDWGPHEENKPQCGTGLTFVEPGTNSADELLDFVYKDYVLGMLESTLQPDAIAHPEEAEGGRIETMQTEEQRVAERIQHAIDSDDFLLVFQPIVSLKGDSQESYSVLLRMRNEDSTLVEAKDFIAVAVKSAKMVAIDRWVIRNAIAQLASKRSEGQKVSFFLTIAEETLQENNLLIWICDSLREFQARGNWLTVQILEDHARRHAAVFTRLTEGLRKVSCRIALKQFGEGPNPELLLRSLHLDYVKFAPNLAKGLADDKTKQQRLQELTKLCRDAGVKSVVTGVEDARSLTVLWTAGIDYVEGNFLQGPSPAIGQTERNRT